MTDLPSYDEIHVISDIHMGGQAGFQILRETHRLANFIRWVGRQRPTQRVALVLNGDVVDTLAEEIDDYVAIDNAVQVLSRIMDDPSFVDIWAALAEFVKTPGRTLVIVLGNHDIEMAFPPVQRLLLSRLAGDDALARGRVEFSTAGAGYACTVGGARIFCVHGNEVDIWNYNRYEDLARVSRRLNAAQPLEQRQWRPNAGTKMVKEVMNGIKRQYAWIDLLKPEKEAAARILLVLDPSQAKKITDAFGVARERAFTTQAEVDARLSMEPRPGLAGPDPAQLGIEEVLGPNLRQAAAVDIHDMLLAAERSFTTPGMGTPAVDQPLGTPQLLWERLTGWISGVGKAEALRRALVDWLANDTSFKRQDEDDTYKQVSASVGQKVDIIVTGHTHLERAIDMGGGRFYFNTGTWIRLLRLTDTLLKDEQSFAAVYEVLVDGKMERIDRASFNHVPFVLDHTSSVSISCCDGEVISQLNHVEGNGSGVPTAIERFRRRAA